MVLHAEVDRDMPYLGTGRKMSKSVHIAGRVLGYGWERRSRSKKRTKVPWYISTYDVGVLPIPIPIPIPLSLIHI